MSRFADDREALDFISSQIAEEAQRERISLSEIERKMLYFSETAWTLPDIRKVSDEFDRDYDQNAYEKKISRLIRKAVSRARKEHRRDFEAWTDAVRRLGKEDRFLLVMVRQSGLHATSKSPVDSLKRWIAGSALLALFGSLVWLIEIYFPDSGYPFTRGASPFGGPILAAIVCVAVAYGFLRLLIGRQKIEELNTRATKWFFGSSKRSR
jgi:hypothetical protein